MKMPDRNMINQPHTRAVVPGTFGFALGAPITVLVTVGPLEIFQLRMAVRAGRLGPFEA
jgi:hypothetical protein